jgi:type I restriction-modification system DNA methylase subunit
MFEPETVHVFRLAQEAGADGMYVFRTSPDAHTLHRPAVLVAEATDEHQATAIHQRIWNLGTIPFLLVVLPHQIRIYTGFDFSVSDKQRGLLRSLSTTRQELRDILADFSAAAIDAGKIWKSEYAKELVPQQRVDAQLLESLQALKNLLQDDTTLSLNTIHALIGKYVYIRYLWDRNIITENWLLEQGIDKQRVFEQNATVEELSRLVTALEKRFNGRIFPLDFVHQDRLKDTHVRMTASVFRGDSLIPYEDKVLQQLHLEFQAYDFCYIPVETLSAVYEQFIEKRKTKGAFYTPEMLADYLLSEVHTIKPLQKGMNILDPSCGSGIFLVLAYRRLIEQERARRPERKLTPEELKTLLESIYGVERETDACYVTEFSLILTLLHYIDPPELDKHATFQFPCLHNTHIYAGDFFDESSAFWQQGLRFDWIVGNPPWIKTKEGDLDQLHASTWIAKNRSAHPVGEKSVAEAFSWRVMDVLKPDGVVGMLLPATSLVNLHSRTYRQTFFQAHEVVRITNFANLRDVLFQGQQRKGGAEMPAATFVYRKSGETQGKPSIIHYSPLSINQYSVGTKELLTITLNEHDIQLLDPYEAEKGETSFWKFALWGTQRDRRAIERLRALFPASLGDYCQKRGWGEKSPRPIEHLRQLYPTTMEQFQKHPQLPQQGTELRQDSTQTTEKLEHLPELQHMKVLNGRHLINRRYRFAIPPEALEANKKHFVRLQGGKSALRINLAPHIILSTGWDFILYSNEDFVIPPRQMGIVGTEEDAGYVQALSMYLNSSLVRYYLFFQVPEWGLYRQRESVVTSQVKTIPTPDFTPAQAQELAALQEAFAQQEAQTMQQVDSLTAFHADRQQTLDRTIFTMFAIPDDIQTLVTEFFQVRLPLDRGRTEREHVTRRPTSEELKAYALELRDELDDFTLGEIQHIVTITHSPELIECVVELTRSKEGEAIPDAHVQEGDVSFAKLLRTIRQNIREQLSQWVYVQRGVRLFDGNRILLYKSPRLIDWTRTQAMNDANDIIGQALARRTDNHDNT